jgi:hypothetical protein
VEPNHVETRKIFSAFFKKWLAVEKHTEPYIIDRISSPIILQEPFEKIFSTISF